MALYRYRENISPRDRFEQIEIPLDDGTATLLKLGGTYNLTYNEYLRASQSVVLVPSTDPISQRAKLIVLPVVGPLHTGDVPVWSEVLAAFIPGIGGGGGGIFLETADTFQLYKVILLSDGTVRAIPIDAEPPDIPTGLATVARLSSVSISWNAAARASTYVVYRGGSEIARASSASYRDIHITSGSTYNYSVQSVDQYGQRSAITSTVSAFIDPSLNVAPTVLVKAWPPAFSSSGKTVLRVNARDANAQVLALELDVDVGTITPTADPSIWIYTP